MGCSSANEDISQKKSEGFFYCFTQDEINLIEQLKEKALEGSSNQAEQKKDQIYPIYQKVVVNLAKKDKTLTDYILLYLPKNLNPKNTAKFDYISEFNGLFLDFTEISKYLKYVKINEKPNFIKSCNLKEEEDYFKTFIEFTTTGFNKENNLIILEVCYNLKFKYSYGFYYLSFSEQNNVPFSISCIIDKNLKLKESGKYVQQEFTSISDSELYIFGQESAHFTLRDKTIKLDIKKEISKNLLSPFSEEEIQLMNYSLNEMVIEPREDNMIYHKVIHKVKYGMDDIKIFYVTFCPFAGKKILNGISSGSDDEKSIIVNKLKINNILLTNTAKEKEEDAKKNIYGTYYSDKDNFHVDYDFRGNFAVFELECESNQNLNYIELNCSELISWFTLEYESSFKYEIILKDNNITFSNPNFKNKIKDGKIISKGYIERYNEQKFIELGKKNDPDFDINNIDKEDRDYEWRSMRKNDLIPTFIYLKSPEREGGAEGEEYGEGECEGECEGEGEGECEGEGEGECEGECEGEGEGEFEGEEGEEGEAYCEAAA